MVLQSVKNFTPGQKGQLFASAFSEASITKTGLIYNSDCWMHNAECIMLHL